MEIPFTEANEGNKDLKPPGTLKLACHPKLAAKDGRASGYRALYSALEAQRVSLNTYAREEVESGLS